MSFDINSLTVGELKEIAKIAASLGVCGKQKEHPRNPAIGKYCVVRCQKAGVHAGIVEEANSEFIVLKDSRRMWFWKSKFTLSEAANTGIQSDSKIASVLDELIIPSSDVAEFIPATKEARKSIEEAKIYVP